METAELIELISRGEDSRHQFKVNISNQDSLAGEIVAFANTEGGRIFIGVTDSGETRGLVAGDIDRLNQMISNASSESVVPPVNVRTENVQHPSGIVMVVTVPNGINKPYMDKRGSIWLKTGADKRRAISREEIQRLFQQSSLLHADETPIGGTGVSDLDLPYFESFFERQYDEKVEDQDVSLLELLQNMNLARNNVLNLAGVLLFSKKPEFRLPAFIVKAVAFPGTEMEDEHYLDSKDIVGKLADVFQQTLAFLGANTAARQGDRSVNTTGESEIPRIVWEELFVNALIHRDYYITAPIRVLVFTDRVEIISPGRLPNNLTVENILAGNSNIRNPILASFGAKILPYRGLGSGVRRALKAYSDIHFKNDLEGNLFTAIIRRNA